MAKYLQGITGAFIGKVGPVVGCIRNGKAYMRSKGSPRTGPPSEKELNNRSKFKAVHRWLQPLLVFIRSGFADYSETSDGYNAAKSYNLKNAMEDGQIVPELVKVSYGDLPLSEEISVTYQDEYLHFNWSPEAMPDTSIKDQIMVLAYHPESQTALYEMHGAFRSMGNQMLNTYREFVGKTVHVYAAFIAADRTRQSESIYLGPIDC